VVADEQYRVAIPNLETQRLLLRKVTLADADDMFAYASDPEVARLTTWETHRTIDDTLATLRRMLGWYDEGFGGPWGLELKEDGTLVGTCGLAVVPEHYRAELGFAIGRRWWGQGLMTETVREVIRFGFAELGLNRIEGRCVPENIGSARVMEKCGMTYEGTLREQFYIKGTFETLRMYSILRREWEDAGRPGNTDRSSGQS
jgi:[ribosomal protein S5]-alanine N-acetyltransferase